MSDVVRAQHDIFFVMTDTLISRDTKELSRLVQTRAIVLNHLEQAECLYIDSFRASGHDAFPSAESDVVSVVESPTPLEPTPPERRISRPRPLRSSRHVSALSNHQSM